MSNIGIRSIGYYLPVDVRTNDWWSAETAAKFASQRVAVPPPNQVSRSGQLIIDALRAQSPDPFRGTKQRHIIAADQSSTDLEVLAARDALERAHVNASEVDLLLTHTVAPEFLLTNSAAKLHGRLGLRRECFALQTEAAAYTFLSQLSVAHAMIASGQATTALLVQSSAASRLVDAADTEAPYFGDAATAVVVGRVDHGGTLASVHYADGNFANTVVAGVPGGTWYSDGRPIIHVADAVGLRDLLLSTVDLCKLSVDTVLARTNHRPEDVDFFCIHQGTSWLRQVAQDYCGLTRAASLETFVKTGYIFSSIMPLGLRMAADRGLLHGGDLVLLFGGGTGMTYGATLLEWGPA